MINIRNKFIDLNSKIQKQIARTQDNYMVIDGKTYTLDGENISEKYQHRLDVKYSDSQIKNFQSHHELTDFEKENGGFVFLFYQINKSMTEYTNNLTKPDIARLLYLTTYTSFNNNKIQYDNGRVISEKDLSKLLRLQPRQYKEYIKKLVDNNILFIDEDNNKYISEHICKNGSINKKQLFKQDIQYTRLFRDTVRRLYDSATVRELSRLSTIYMILPYINLYTNIVSYNPNERDHDKVIPMTLIDLASKLGYTDYNKLKTTMYKTVLDDQYVFGFFLFENDRRTMRVIVNPRIVYASNANNLTTICALFNSNK